MPNIKSACLIFLFFVICHASAQKFELGKVSVRELEEKAYPDDTTAAAAIIYNKAKSTFIYTHQNGFSLVHQYEFRIKIYKKEGLQWANFSVPYYVGYENIKNDMIQFSNAVTYNLENGSIKKTKLTAEGKFKKEISEFWNVASITMPNVKVGSVIEFKYTLKSEDVNEFPIFHIQYDIPVLHSEYVTEIPQYYTYKPILIGFRKIQSDAKITDGYQNFENEYHQTINMSYPQVTSSYISDNIPALKMEEYVDNIGNYRSAIVHELEETNFPDQSQRRYATTWEAVAANIYKDDRFGKELKERQYFEPFVAQFVSEGTESQKLKAVFDYVQRTMNWDNNYGYLTKKGVRKAYAERTGNVAEINLMLIAMLNHAGIKAWPVLISTKDNGVPVFPNRTVFNYVIAVAEIDGHEVLLDATSKYSSPGILPLRDINWMGRLIRQDGTSKEINLVPQLPSKQTVNMLVKTDSQGVSGSIRIEKSNHFAYNFKEKYEGLNRESYIEKLENDLNNIRISDYAVELPKEDTKPVTETFSFASNNLSEIIGDKMYIDPMLFFATTRNPFIPEKRELPIYYPYPYQVKYNINFEIPAGYVVESIPESMSISTTENVCGFSFNIVSTGNKIQLSATEEINQAIIAASYYEYLKGFFEKIVSKQNEKIVLKKT